MDQNQAINFLAKIIDDAKLTRQERDTANMALQLIRQLGQQFTELVLAERKRVEVAAKPPEPKKNPDAVKPPIDIPDKSQA